MIRRRMKEPDRRDSILDAATTVFAEGGFGRTTTNDLAQAAGVSPALLYRHFPSKEALHKAVLQRMVSQQDESHERYGRLEPSTKGIFTMLSRFMTLCAHTPSSPRARRGTKLLLLSLAGDNEFAKLTFSRAAQLNGPPLKAALAAAEAAGDLDPKRRLDPDNAQWFIYGVGQTIAHALLTGSFVIPYKGSKADIVKQAVIFCARALGFTDKAIERHYVANPLTASRRKPVPAAKAAPNKPTRRKA